MPKAVSYILAVVLGGLGLVMLLWRGGPNLWIGVRLPWTFADREIWDRSWLLVAVLLVGVGLVSLVSWKLFLIAVVLLVIVCILYPIYLYRQKYGTLRFWKDAGWADYHPVARCRGCGHWQKLPEAAALAGARCEACQRPLQEN